MVYSTPVPICAEESLAGNTSAVVTQDDRVAYLHLVFNSGVMETRSCWLRNLIPGPHGIGAKDISEGLAPLMPKALCAHPQGESPLVADDLEFVWFEEGNGVALFEKGELLALIPPSLNSNDTTCFARDCRQPNTLCLPLPEDPGIKPMFRELREYWASWEVPENHPKHNELVLQAYRDNWGTEIQLYAVASENWPPRYVAHFQSDGRDILATVGMSLRPQPNLELDEEGHFAPRRIELAFVNLSGTWSESVEQTAMELTGLAGFPWTEFAPFTTGSLLHSESNETSLLNGSNAVELHNRPYSRPVGDNPTPADIVAVPLPELPDFRKDRLVLLWAVRAQQ